MFLTGRPLLDSQRDVDLLVGRDVELAQLQRAAAANLNTVVVGERGVGATSLVHALAHHLRAAGGITPVVVRCGGTRSVLDVLTRVVLALPGPGLAIDTASGLLQQLGQAALYEDLVLVVDDLPPVVGAQLLAEHRDELWAIGVPWVVTATADVSAGMLTAPGDAFFEVRLDLVDLDAGDVGELLSRRLPGTSAGELAQLAAAAGCGHPRRVLDVARSVISLGNGRVGPEFTAHTAALAALGRPAHMLHSELVTVGSASASDAALQDRMGWTRPRVHQVLTQLEGAGLVRAATSRPAGGQGRPRKVFSPVPPADWFTQQQVGESA